MKTSEFNKFSDAKGLEKPCPDCGTKKWSLVGTIDPVIVGEGNIPIQMTIGDNGTGFGVYPLFCTNCGHVKTYAAHVIDQWVKDNG